MTHEKPTFDESYLEGYKKGTDGVYEKTTYVTVPKVTEEYVDVDGPKEVVYVQREVPKLIEEVIEKKVKRDRKSVDLENANNYVLKPVKNLVERPVMVTKEVPVERIVQVEHVVEVPGEIIEIPKRVLIETNVVVPRYIDDVVPTVIIQNVEPRIRESDGSDGHVIDVTCRVISFKPHDIDIFVPLPVERSLVATKWMREYREIYSEDVPAEQYNALVRSLNANIELEHLMPLFKVSREVAEKIKKGDYKGIREVGSIECSSGPGAAFVPVPPNVKINPPTASLSGSFQKVFPGAYPSGKNNVAISHESLKSVPNMKNRGKHRYAPYNYGFRESMYVNPKKSHPFNLHHHIGVKKK